VKLFTCIFSVLILISTSTYYIFGEETSTIEREEAPAAVWDMKINDSEVDLYINGYWKIGVLGGVSVESGPDGIIFPAAFPGLTDFRFYQEPDVTISLWLKNRYYLETTFLEGFDKNTYAIGYRGQEGEVLQAVRIGNSEIGIADYEGIDVPSPKYNTPGITADFQTSISTHDVLIRYDPTSEQKKTFLGDSEVKEEFIELGEFKRGQYFVLPDRDLDSGSLEVYIADSRGPYTSLDGDSLPFSNFRRASTDEYSHSLSQGTLTLSLASESEVAVFYTKSGVSVGNIIPASPFIVPLVNGEPDPSDTGTYSSFSWTDTDSWFPGPGGETYESTSSVEVNGKKALLLFQPGKISPFESYNRYRITTKLPEEQWKKETFLADNSLSRTDESSNYSFSADSESSTLTVDFGENTDTRSPYNRYPFADNFPQIYTVEPLDREKTGRVIILSVRSSSGIVLGGGVVPGSEKIYINGYETGAAEVDYTTGKVTFSRFIYPQDRIEIIYRTETTDMGGGDLLVAQGNRFYPAENLELYFAEMFRWNIAGKAAASEAESSPGGLTVAGGLSYKRDNFNLFVNGTGGFNTPNTTGTLRIAGMGESGYSFSAGRNLIKPAPAEIWADGMGMTATTRSELTYTDYLSTDGLGQYFLNPYTWTEPLVNPTVEGPSSASELSTDPFDGNVLVFDYNLNDGEWSAGDLLLNPEGPIDLSHYDSLSLYIWADNPTEIKASILLGENGEASDYDEDGYRENYDEAFIVSISPTLSAASGEWKRYEYSFTPEEKKKLTRSRSMRILLEKKSGVPPISGRLMVGGLHFEGSRFNGTTIDGDSNSAGDQLYMTETGMLDPVVAELATTFPETVELFQSKDEEQKALRIKWELSNALSDSWTATTYTESVSPESYGTFSFYAYSQSSSATYDIDLTDSRNRGYHFSYSPGSSGWKKVNLSLETGVVTDGSENIIANALIDPLMGDLNSFTISGQDSSSLTGTFYLDELHYSDPSFTLDGTVDVRADYALKGTLLESPGGFPFLADFTLSNDFSYRGGSVLSEAADSYHSLENSTSLGITMMLLEIKAHGKINYGATGTLFSGSHSLLFPSGFSYAALTDSYSRSGSGNTSAMTRANSLKLTLPGYGLLVLSSTAQGTRDNLVQNWSAETDWTLFSKLKVNLTGDMEQNELWDYRDRGNYFSNWINDYLLLIPHDVGILNRNFQTAMKIELETRPVGFVFMPSLSFTLDERGVKTQTDKGSVKLSLPLSFEGKRDNPWTLTPSYSREFIEKRSAVPSGSYGQGFRNLFSDLANWMPLTSFIPFYELFAGDPVAIFEDKTAFLDSASYKPAFSIDFSRKAGSSIGDLFLPSSIDLSFARTFHKKDDSLSSLNNFDLTVKQSAVNLFGRFGVYETFGFYDSEDITSSLQFTMEGQNGNFPKPKELIYQHYLAFYGQNNRTLTLENRFSTDFIKKTLSDSLNFKFLWRGENKEEFSLDFLNRLIDKEHYWSHEENVQLKLFFPLNGNIDDDLSSFILYLKHISAVNVPGLGALKGWLTYGFFIDEELVKTGFEAGMELEISF